MHIDVFEKCRRYGVDLEQLREKYNNIYVKVAQELDFEADEPYITLAESDINEAKIPSEVVNYDDYEFDESTYEDILSKAMQNKKFNHYLVYASGIKWNGASGCSIMDELSNTLRRSYDCTMVIVDQCKDGFVFVEYNHDAPTGRTSYVLGLSNKDYEKLYNERNFNKITEYVNRRVS